MSNQINPFNGQPIRKTKDILSELSECGDTVVSLMGQFSKDFNDGASTIDIEQSTNVAWLQSMVYELIKSIER